VAIKAYRPSDDNGLSMKRDILIGFEKRLESEYTLNYQDEFIAGQFHCVVMEFMNTSLNKILNPLISSSPKTLLSDEVYNFLILFFIKICFRMFC
jgi:hypothetical protein